MYNIDIHVLKNSIIVIFLYHKRHIVELACESVMWYISDVKVIIENIINRITSDALDDGPVMNDISIVMLSGLCLLSQARIISGKTALRHAATCPTGSTGIMSNSSTYGAILSDWEE